MALNCIQVQGLFLLGVSDSSYTLDSLQLDSTDWCSVYLACTPSLLTKIWLAIWKCFRCMLLITYPRQWLIWGSEPYMWAVLGTRKKMRRNSASNRLKLFRATLQPAKYFSNLVWVSRELFFISKFPQTPIWYQKYNIDLGLNMRNQNTREIFIHSSQQGEIFVRIHKKEIQIPVLIVHLNDCIFDIVPDLRVSFQNGVSGRLWNLGLWSGNWTHLQTQMPQISFWW